MAEEKITPCEIPMAPPMPFFEEGENERMSFGKYTNLTFNELLHEDKKDYIDWLITQSWFPNKSPILFEFLCSAGRIPLNYVHERNNTSIPSSIEMKARYVNDDQLLNIIQGLICGRKYDINIVDRFFEDPSGFDIRVEVEQNLGGWSGKKKFSLYLNVVPFLRDNCLDLLRLMNKHANKIDQPNPICALVIIEYRGSINLETIRDMYGNIEILETTPVNEK